MMSVDPGKLKRIAWNCLGFALNALLVSLAIVAVLLLLSLGYISLLIIFTDPKERYQGVCALLTVLAALASAAILIYARGY